jgi:transposase-like protein
VGTTVDTVGSSNNRKRRPNYSVDFTERLAKQACKPGVSVSKLARQHGINVNKLSKWRRDLCAGLLAASGSQSVHLLPAVVVQRAAAILIFLHVRARHQHALSKSLSPMQLCASALAPTPRCRSSFSKVCAPDRPSSYPSQA